MPETRPGYVPPGARENAYYFSLFTQAGYRRAAEQDPARCENCRHLRVNRIGRRNFYKCALIGITPGRETDVILSGVCNRFDADKRKMKEKKQLC